LPQRILIYRFAEKYVLRDDAFRVDTFYVPVSGIDAFEKKEKVAPGNAADELHVFLKCEGRKETIVCLKRKDVKSEIDKADDELE
jgi:hypothetical protein